ncbi:MAG: fused response regulator/phosphatase [Verrucomicrobiia bacterium]|jgi:sigma-B regulation protein RsbU (phosphoserine phosphatase)
MSAQPIPLLIVEDNPMYAEVLQRLLPALGTELRFDAQWVNTGEKAVEEIRRRTYDLVLLDYKLPGADGLTVLTQIRSLPAAQQPAVIMLSGMGGEDVAIEAMKNGAKDYLHKDSLDVPSLLRAITGALERKRLEEQVASYTEELRLKNSQMQDDLSMAREIQEAFLPQRYPCFPCDIEPNDSALRFYHRYHPTSAVGGDFFDVLALSDTEAGVFICDVMGHGVRAALVAALIRGCVEELKDMAADPGRFLTEINRLLVTTLRQTRLPMFVSAFYLVADVGAGEIRCANAGHPSPLHLQRDAGTVEPLQSAGCNPGPALGVFEDSTYPTARQALAAHDVIVLFTDGLFEVSGRNDEQYGQERLLTAVRQRVHQPPAALFDELLEDIQAFGGGSNAFVDDVCLVGVEAVRVGIKGRRGSGGR